MKKKYIVITLGLSLLSNETKAGFTDLLMAAGAPVAINWVNNRFFPTPQTQATPKYIPTEKAFQIPVLQQTNQTDCGFHAAKNAIYITNQLFENKSIRNTKSDEESLKKNTKITSPEIFASFKHNALADIGIDKANQLLDQLDIQFILNSENIKNLLFLGFPTLPNTANLTDPDLINKRLTTIPEVNAIIQTPEYIFKKGDLVNIIKNYQKSEEFIHAFIMGSMKTYETPEGQLKTTEGHWFTIVIHKKDGKLNLIFADSRNNKSLEENDVYQNITFELIKQLTIQE